MSTSTYQPMYSASAFDGKGGLQFDEAQYMEFSDLNLISKDLDFTGMTVFIVAHADRDEHYAYLSKNTTLEQLNVQFINFGVLGGDECYGECRTIRNQRHHPQ